MTQDITQHWSKTEEGQKLVLKAFETAGLPEVKENQLEPGTYTNQQIAEKFNNPVELVRFLIALPKSGSVASNRCVASFALDTVFPPV